MIEGINRFPQADFGPAWNATFDTFVIVGTSTTYVRCRAISECPRSSVKTLLDSPCNSAGLITLILANSAKGSRLEHRGTGRIIGREASIRMKRACVYFAVALVLEFALFLSGRERCHCGDSGLVTLNALTSQGIMTWPKITGSGHTFTCRPKWPPCGLIHASFGTSPLFNNK